MRRCLTVSDRIRDTLRDAIEDIMDINSGYQIDTKISSKYGDIVRCGDTIDAEISFNLLDTAISTVTETVYEQQYNIV